MSETADFQYQPMYPLAAGDTPWRHLSSDHVTQVTMDGERFLKVDGAGLTALARAAFHDIAYYLRPGHLAQLRTILDDAEASQNDRFVAYELLKNANISAGGILPMCQDTGTAIILGKRGHRVLTAGDDESRLAEGVFRTYVEENLRYSQLAPRSMFDEVNTGSNLPAQIDLMASTGESYDFLFIAKGGGSANKTYFYQETPALLNPDSLLRFIDEKIRTLGTAACPPYHLAIVVGGTSAEMTLKTVKLASCRYLDGLPEEGNALGHAIRDRALEEKVHELTRKTGIGAQFGGKYFCHDVRVIRLPRHGASLPVAIGVSCSADRQALGRITAEGLFLEALEHDPGRFMPDIDETALGGDVVEIDLNQPMKDILATLSRHPIKTRLSLSGTLVVARDLAHARIKALLDAGKPMPSYMKDHPVYYAGPAKTPQGMASGSFGPTTAGRMDSYVDQFQAAGGSLIMLAKGNRSAQVVRACKAHGGFHLGSTGGPAARLARDCIRKVSVLDYEELGMEAVWKIEVENFPAFIVIDDKGHDFFSGVTTAPPSNGELLSL